MELGLKDKVTFVAASSKGLGKAVAKELVQEGARVIVNGRNKEVLQNTKHELDNLNFHSVVALQGDLSDKNDRNRIIQDALTQFSQIDILVTNTGGPPSGNFESFNKEDWDNAYELLLGSAVELIRGFLPGMKAQKWGRIIGITSVAVKQPVDYLILSNAVRASVVGLFKSLSNELGEFGITVNNVMPGYTNTERLKKLHDSNPSFQETVKTIPLGRIGEPKEFAAAVSFLASERASYITGISLPVDGGAIKHVF
jgi:3-oxoacyl-[acyl-carrier protein] reductase